MMAATRWPWCMGKCARWRRMLAVALTICLVASGVTSLQAQDPEKSLRELVDAFADAWNRGDAAGVAATWAPDASYTLPGGGIVEGRASLHARFGEALRGPEKGSRRQHTITRIRFVRPDVAVVDGAFEVTGGTIPRRSGFTFVAQQDNGEWLIAIWHVLPAPVASEMKGMKGE